MSVLRTVCAITRKGHSDFITLRKDVMEAMGWRRGDKLLAVRWEDTLVLVKLDLSKVTDRLTGQMLRRSRGEEPKLIEGPWGQRYDRNKPEK